MSRRLRPNLPGVVFHVTARIQGRAPLFAGIESLVQARILAARQRSDAELVAYAVMPNHLHVMIRQGQQPLSHFMQPMLRRISVLVQKRTGLEGHVFERRFRSWPCLDPDYLRNSLAYVHLNAIRAGIATRIDEYAWCSHAVYDAVSARVSIATDDVSVENTLRMFAARDDQTLAECRDNYRAFLEWRCAMDVYARRDPDDLNAERPVRPMTDGGDVHWTRCYAPPASGVVPHAVRTKQELPDIARATIFDVAPGMELEQLRSGAHGRMVVRVRRRFILRARSAGHSCQLIARFLRVSTPTVSSVITAARQISR